MAVLRAPAFAPPRRRGFLVGAAGHSSSAAAAPVIIIEVAEAVEAALQFVGAAALLFGDLPARHVSAPLEVGLNVGDPCRSSQAASKAAVRFSLDRSDACIDFARRALAFDISAAVIASELERKAAIAVEPQSLSGYRPGGEPQDGDTEQGFLDTHRVLRLQTSRPIEHATVAGCRP